MSTLIENQAQTTSATWNAYKRKEKATYITSKTFFGQTGCKTAAIRPTKDYGVYVDCYKNVDANGKGVGMPDYSIAFAKKLGIKTLAQANVVLGNPNVVIYFGKSNVSDNNYLSFGIREMGDTEVTWIDLSAIAPGS